jgi:hypothetical protein
MWRGRGHEGITAIARRESRSVRSTGTSYPHAESPQTRQTTHPPSCTSGAPHSGHAPSRGARGDSSGWTNVADIDSHLA